VVCKSDEGGGDDMKVEIDGCKFRGKKFTYGGSECVCMRGGSRQKIPSG